MKNKSSLFYFLLIVLFAVISPVVFSEKEIFKGNVATDVYKEIDGTDFKFVYDEISNQAFVETSMSSLIVENGECIPNDRYKVCLNSANFSFKDDADRYHYNLDVTIYKLTGLLSVNISIGKKTLINGESTEMTIRIFNPNNADIINISYNQDLSMFFIRSLNGCELDEKHVKWSGAIKPNFEKVCTATITAEKEGEYNLAANYSFFNFFETESGKSHKVDVTVLPHQLNINRTIDSSIEINMPFYMNITFKNIDESDYIDLRASIILPSGMKLLKGTGINNGVNEISFNKRLDAVSSDFYYFYILPSSESKSPIKEKYEYILRSVKNTIENDIKADVLNPYPIINLTSEYKEIREGGKFVILAKIKNPSFVYGIKGIKASLNVPYNFPVQRNLDVLQPNESYLIISNTFLAPLNKNVNELTVELNIDYKDANGIAKTISKSIMLPLILKNGSKIINITNITSQNDANINENLSLKTDDEPQDIAENNAGHETSTNAETKQNNSNNSGEEQIQVTKIKSGSSLSGILNTKNVIAMLFFIAIFILLAVHYALRDRNSGGEA